MKTVKLAMALCMALLLQGCFGDIGKAKDLRITSSESLTYGEMLKELCSDLEWSKFEEKQQKLVKATCLVRLQDLGWGPKDKRDIDQQIDTFAADLKEKYDSLLARAEKDAARNLPIIQNPSSPQLLAYVKPMWEKNQRMATKLREGQADFRAYVDSMRQLDLQAMDKRFQEDHRVTAEFIFANREGNMQLAGLRTVKPEPMINFEAYDVFRLITFVLTKNADEQVKFWRGVSLRDRIVGENLRKAYDLYRTL